MCKQQTKKKQSNGKRGRVEHLEPVNVVVFFYVLYLQCVILLQQSDRAYTYKYIFVVSYNYSHHLHILKVCQLTKCAKLVCKEIEIFIQYNII